MVVARLMEFVQKDDDPDRRHQGDAVEALPVGGPDGGLDADERPKRAAKTKAAPQHSLWPSELPMPPGPRSPPDLCADRFPISAQFGDEVSTYAQDTRPVPNVIFHNSLEASSSTKSLAGTFKLPETIYFYLRIKFQRVGYPFPPGISQKYLLAASRVQSEGGAAATAVARVLFDEKHVIGLTKFHMQTFAQIVLEVPSTDRVNPGLHPTRLSFHPRHLSQLHRSVHGGSERSEGLPRLIVPVWPVKARPAKRVVVMRHRSPVGTFGSSDGRMGPAFLPVAVQKSLAARWRSQMDMRAAAVEAAALTHDTNVKPQLRPEGKRANGRRELAQNTISGSQNGTDEVSERRVMRPSFLMA